LSAFGENIPASFKVRRMSRSEVAEAEGWAAKEGWSPGKYDADYFYSADPGWFFAGELAGRLIGCIFAVSYSDDFGFLGCYLVCPQFRRKGLGGAIWNADQNHLGKRNIGLRRLIIRDSSEMRKRTSPGSNERSQKLLKVLLRGKMP